MDPSPPANAPMDPTPHHPDVERSAEEIAAEASQKTSSYVAAISHELRTPMNGILGMSSLLLDSGLRDDQVEYVETIHSAAETLILLLNEILDLSKIESGRLEVGRAPFSPQQVCEESLRLLRARAEQQGLQLRAEIDDELPTHCEGDGLRLNQILVNLLGNAVKFTPQGRVTLRVRRQWTEASRVGVRFEVEDSGIGIEPEVLPRIFEPFAQANGSSGSAYGGTGLGLAISQRLLGLMGSKLEVRSVPEQGTTFWFDITWDFVPATEDDGSGVEHGDVLYVGAAGERRRRFVEALTERGHRVEARDLSATALERIRERCSSGAPFGTVYVEQQLPDLDGETLGRSVRNRLRITDLPLYLVRTTERDVDPARAARSGFDGVLAGPEDLDDGAGAPRADTTASADPSCPRTNPTNGDAAPHGNRSNTAARVEAPHDGHRTVAPTPPSPRPAAHSCESSAGAAAEAPIVLVVEDNPVNQKVVCHMLRKMGFTVELAEDGQQGVERLRDNDYDLVLMDCQMPVMDGYEATRTIRSMGRDKSGVPVVALTANAMEGDREKCLAAGMDDYMSKPAKSDQLREMMHKWIPDCADRLAQPV